MQTIKHKIFSLLAVVIAMNGILVVTAPQAAALTEEQIRECYRKWNNATIPNRSDPKYTEYRNSGCTAPEACGANTDIHEDPNRPITPKCTNPDQTPFVPPGSEDEGDAGAAVECSVLPDFICRAATQRDLENSAIWLMLIWIINILTIGIGVAAVGAIVFAGFLYTTARDDAGQVKKSLEIIRNTVIGLIVYAFMYAILQYLIPGGIFANNTPLVNVAHAHIQGDNRRATI